MGVGCPRHPRPPKSRSSLTRPANSQEKCPDLDSSSWVLLALIQGIARDRSEVVSVCGQHIPVALDDDDSKFILVPEIRSSGLFVSNTEYRSKVFKGAAGLRLRISSSLSLLHRPHKEVQVPTEFGCVPPW